MQKSIKSKEQRTTQLYNKIKGLKTQNNGYSFGLISRSGDFITISGCITSTGFEYILRQMEKIDRKNFWIDSKGLTLYVHA